MAALAFAASLDLRSLLYLLYIGVSLVFGAIASTTLAWMLHAWRSPTSFADRRPGDTRLAPTHSFSLIVPARHEEGVLASTLSRLLTSDHPAFEVIVVVGSDDAATRDVAEVVAARHPGRVKVIVDASWPKNKPRALNVALPYCSGMITGVFDAEDVVHPALLRRIDECFQDSDPDVVQAGVQLMNFRSSWLTVRNVLEYYFWFRSRLHLHARQRFIPLGGNTVFVRTELLRGVSGWDEGCLAEDCELGVRLSALGARTVVVYEPELVTREECPPSIRAFARQRTRWNQGYLQTLLKGHWRRLPLGQRALGFYILAMPYLLTVAWLMFPLAIVTVLAVNAPVPIALVSFLPALPMLSMLAVEVAGLGDFCRAYGERASLGDYVRLVVGLPFYQAVLAFAAARAVVREARGVRGWEKTAHLGLHLSSPAGDAEPAGANGRPQPGSRRRIRCEGRIRIPAHAGWTERAAAAWRELPRLALGDLAVPIHTVHVRGADRRLGRLGHLELGGFHDHPRPPVRATPLRVNAGTANGSGSIAAPFRRPPRVGWPARALSGAARVRPWRAAVARPDLAVQIVLLVGVGIVLGTNMFHWPDTQFDEGTYMGNAWAMQHGALAPYTYGYGHPPLAWLLIALWTWASGLLGHATYSIETGRELMFVVDIVSCSLLYTLARRLGVGRAFAALAVVIFAFSPVALFYHRQVLLDNPAIAWALAAFVLALTPERRLWAFAASGACFAASVLSKETTLVLLPALLVAASYNGDVRTRRYCATLFISFFLLIALIYPLYATLKGELLPGRGHVSLMGETIVQLFTRQATGSIFDPHSQTHAIVVAWLKLDPWLVGAALALAPVALVRRRTRAIALAFLIQVVMIARPGYLPNMYVLGLLPFAALIIAATGDAAWRLLTGDAARRRRSFAAVLLTRVALAASALALLASAAVAALDVAPRWARVDHQAMTLRVDGPQRAAEAWLLRHVGHDKRLIVSDDFWIYLIEHGFDQRPVPGGFFSRTVVFFWPLDYDPAVKRRFPGGWRDFDYVVSTEGMRVETKLTPTAAAAIVHSRVLATFGSGPQRIEIRAIDKPRSRG